MTTSIGTGAVHFRMINRYHRNPCSTVVAGFTNIRRINVTNTFASGRRTIVTREASAINLRMINCHYRHPGRKVVAGLTYIGRINMSRPHTGSSRTIMTTKTVVHDAIMTKDNTN